MASTGSASGFLPPTREIGFDSPWRWLEAGWRDLRRSPAVSLGYGLLFAALGCLLSYGLWRLGAWYAILPLASGFMLVGPLVAVGLYEVSRRHASGEPVSVSAALGAWRRNPGALSAIGIVLMLVFLLWIRIATLLFALVYGSTEFHVDSFFAEYFFSHRTIGFLAGGTLIGAALATVVFSISAISLPMIVVRKASATEAVLTSVRAVARNWQPFVLWAGLVVIFSIAGLLAFYIGLIVTLPLIGHASYHAYREVVGD
jgi:uncharacterized membrane protein